tara:strand:+ start:3167 stop:3757 length:591 start_codon:yes stop_codon:yes gene_type:complete
MSKQLHPADKPLLRLGAYLGGFVAIFAFALLGLLIAKAPVRSSEPSFSEETANARKAIADKVKAADVAALTEPELIDEASGVVRIPIAAAKDVVLEELQSLKPKKSAIPLPGSAAATKLMQEQSAPAPAAKAEPKEEAPKKPKAKPQAAEKKTPAAAEPKQPKKPQQKPKADAVPTDEAKPASKPETPAKPSNPQG